MAFQNLTIVGNVGRNSEFKFTAQGIAVLKFSVAVNKTTGKGDDKRQTTTWFTMTVCPSSLPVSATCPSGLNATLVTLCVWPTNAPFS